jgi:hypothetical protein
MVTDAQKVGSGDDLEWDGREPHERSDEEQIAEMIRLFRLAPARTQALLDQFPAIARGEADDATFDEFHADVTSLEQVDTIDYLTDMVFELLDRGVWDEAIARIKESE